MSIKVEMTTDGAVFCTELSASDCSDKKQYSYEEAISKAGNKLISF